MTQQNTMPDEIFVIKGVTERFDGVWDDYQWSDQRGTKYLRADLHTDLLKQARKALFCTEMRLANNFIPTPSELDDALTAIDKALGE